MTDPIPPGARTTVRRRPERGVYDREVVHAILDAGLVAHVAFVVDAQPFVLPMAYARIDDTLVLHGAAASRLQKQLGAGVPVSVGVTLLDGLVLARSAYHHSMNYRSVVAFGTARTVTDEAEKRRAFDALVEHVVRGRATRVRAASPNELRGTHVLSLHLDEVSAKVRVGPPVEDEDDLGLPIWSGIVPLPVLGAAPVPAPDLTPGQEPTDVELAYRRP